MRTLIAVITLALLLLGATGVLAESVAGGARIDGDFTIVWKQRVDDPTVATTQPSFRVGDFRVELRPAVKAKPKDAPAFQVVMSGDTASKTLVYPGKWYHFALVGAGGKVQLFVNGFPDAAPRPAAPPAAGVLAAAPAGTVARVEDLFFAAEALAPADVLAPVKQKMPAGRTIVTVAHRGVHKHAPENTRISYVQAIEAGAPIVEFDTALTSDGHIVGMHDKTVDRTTDGTGKIAEMTLEQVRKLEAGSWKDPKYKGEPVPTLDEVAEVVRGKAVLMLDLKAEGQGAAIAKWLESTKYPHDQVIIAPWEDHEAVALRKHVPMTVPMVRLTSKVPTEQPDDAYFEKMKSIGLSGFSVNWQYLTEPFTRAAQKHGMKVYTWTLNEPPDIAGAALLGVDGVITDDSAATIKLLAELLTK